MLVVFEGIDGSGKTTVSNRVARLLRQDGLTVEHVRQDGQFRSRAVQSIRELGRDARNMALAPRTELLLLAARDAQLMEEVTTPALRRVDVVLADRYFYTAEVLAEHGRGLSREVIEPVLLAASGGMMPDLVILLDVDPYVAHARRRIAKIITPDLRPPSRKGLAGAGLAHRLRGGYLSLAARAPERWITIDASGADLDGLAVRLTAIVATAVQRGTAEARVLAAPHAPSAPCHTPLATPSAALERLLDWVDRRRAGEPALAAYLLGGLAGHAVDGRRRDLAHCAPEVTAAGLRGLGDPVSWELRHRLADRVPRQVARSLGQLSGLEADLLRRRLATGAPDEVAHSLIGVDDSGSWEVRDQLDEKAPQRVVASLAGLDSPRAWRLREAWLERKGGLEQVGRDYDRAAVAAESISGLDGARAWEWRRAAFAAAPVAALASLRGITGTDAWDWRERFLSHAPKVILRGLVGSIDPRAWAFREAMAPICTEALDSLYGLDDSAAWRLRDCWADRWPGAVVKSLGALASNDAGVALVRRQLARHPGHLALLKLASAIALGIPSRSPEL